MMHVYLATPRARRWMARRRSCIGDKLVFITALALLALFALGVL